MNLILINLCYFRVFQIVKALMSITSDLHFSHIMKTSTFNLQFIKRLMNSFSEHAAQQKIYKYQIKTAAL